MARFWTPWVSARRNHKFHSGKFPTGEKKHMGHRWRCLRGSFFTDEETSVTPFVSPAATENWHLIQRPVGDNPIWILQRRLTHPSIPPSWEKWKMGLYHMLKKVWWYVKPFRYNAGAQRTDGRTESLYQYHASTLLCWRAIKTTEFPWN